MAAVYMIALQVVGVKRKQHKHKLVYIQFEKLRARRTDFVEWVLVVQIMSLHPLFFNGENEIP